MSNRTDFSRLAWELVKMGYVTATGRERVATELHDAYVAGEEGHGCACWSCAPPAPCEGEHDYHQAQCGRCGREATGAGFLEAARKFRESMAARGIDDPFAGAFCEHGRLVTRGCDDCDAGAKGGGR